MSRMPLLKIAVLAIGLCTAGVQAGPVNINTADSETLSKLVNGVGPKLADAIVRYREQFGPFRTIDDLAKVKGVGAKLVERNRDVFTQIDTREDHSAGASSAVK